MSRCEFTITATHPCLPGHFPRQPIVPGVVMLERVIEAIEAATGGRVTTIRRCKFVQPLRPEQACTIEWTRQHDTVRFECACADGTLAKGVVGMADS